MRATKSVFAGLLTAAALLPISSHAQDVLTGDKRLACEALLCLATASPPHECTAALSRYFSIKLGKPGDTARARANFLKLCPRGEGRNGLPAASHRIESQGQSSRATVPASQ